jgi:hypothetical protein
MVPASGRVLVTITARLIPFQSDDVLMSFTSVGGSGNVTASDEIALRAVNGNEVQGSATYPVVGLSPGNHTFTAKYRISGLTGAIFLRRSIIVIPLP